MAKKTVSMHRLLISLYEHNKDALFTPASSSITPMLDIAFSFDPYGMATYCKALGTSIQEGFRITIGGVMWRDSYRPIITTTSVDRDGAKEVIPQYNKLLRGLFYHEIGHLKFTNMLDRQILDYKTPALIPSIHKFFNVFEDIVIERFGMSVRYPWTKKYFELLTKNLFEEDATKYSDKGTADSFIEYLLYMLRCGYKAVPHNKVYEAHKEYLSAAIKSILVEPNSSTRITKTIELVEWLQVNSELDFKHVTPPAEEEKIVKGLSSDPSSPLSGSGSATSSNSDDVDESDLGGTSSAKTEDRSGNSSSSGTSSPFTSGNKGRDAGSSRFGGHASSGTEKESFDIDSLRKASELEDDGIDPGEYIYSEENDLMIDEDAVIESSFNDVLLNLMPHRFIDARDYYKPRSMTAERIDKRLAKFNQLCLEVATALRVLQTRNKPRMQPGYSSGKLHMRSVVNSHMSGRPTANIFQRKIDNGIQPDLAISILCDNSGSMSGNKAYVATNALMALAQACDICNIPLEVSAFTEGRGYNWTVRMKSFKESFDAAKIYFGIADSDLLSTYVVDKDIPTFYGNEDEANIYHVWQAFKNNTHKNKILIVISDGSTCGSTSGLKKLIEQVSNSGIYVLGLGIQSEAVKAVYPNYKLFDTAESLNGLPDFLVDTLLKFASGGRG